jgi:hypothetical protein
MSEIAVSVRDTATEPLRKLAVAIEGCCKGHLCDNCKTCQSGRCCRRDNPDYKLPGLGEWDGPIYGELGVLNDDGERVECHFCGTWHIRVALHAWKAHDITTDEYKAIIGLRRRVGLYAPKKRESWSRSHRDDLVRASRINQALVASATPEQRSAWGSKKKRLQSFLDPSLKDLRLSRGRKANAAAAALARSQTHCKRGHPFTGDNLIVLESGRRACRTCRNRRNAAYRERHRRDQDG